VRALQYAADAALSSMMNATSAHTAPRSGHVRSLAKTFCAIIDSMSVERGRKLIRQLKYLVEDNFPELDVEYTADAILIRVKDGNSGRGSSGHS